MTLGWINVDANMAVSIGGLVLSAASLIISLESIVNSPEKKRARRRWQIEKRAFRHYRERSGTRLTKQERCSAAELYETTRCRSAEEAEQYLLSRGKHGNYAKYVVKSFEAEGEISEGQRFGRCRRAAAFFSTLVLKGLSLYNKISYA